MAAVSGGADSLALGLLLAALGPGRGWTVELATLDHGQRGGAGARDRQFVEEVARSEGLACHSERTDASAAAAGLSGEDAARRARRRFLLGLAERRGAAVALGHTRDDQAETVLYRLARGSGLLGAGGMRRWSPPLWRPLLGIPRETLRGLLRAWDQPWAEDETNFQRDAVRNRIRMDVLPALDHAVGGGAAEGLARAAELAAEDERLVQELADARRGSVPIERAPGRVWADRRALAAIEPPLRRRIVRDLLLEIGGEAWRPTSAHLLALDGLIEARSSGTRIDLPGAFLAERRGAWIVIEAGKKVARNELDK